jgi:hypothetical protein
MAPKKRGSTSSTPAKDPSYFCRYCTGRYTTSDDTNKVLVNLGPPPSFNNFCPPYHMDNRQPEFDYSYPKKKLEWLSAQDIAIAQKYMNAHPDKKYKDIATVKAVIKKEEQDAEKAKNEKK